MGRQELIAKLQKKRQEQSSDETSFWHDLNERIEDKKLIPLISNSVRLEAIFNVGETDSEEDDRDIPHDNEDDTPELTLEEILTRIWAEELGYPLPNKHQLARVAQYNRVKSADDYQAKTRYLRFLKEKLLNLAEDEQPELVEELRSDLARHDFAHLATELGYPRYRRIEADPLRLLAKLDLPVYATTSYFDFLERALIAENKHPRTQVCFWSGQSIRMDVSQPASQHDFHLETDFLPTAQNPLVYHLYGLEKYPESLVLSEDDYLDFLGRIWHDFNQYEKVISDYLRQVLTQSSLLLLGYRLQDWEFRVLFRGIINATPLNTRQHYSIAIQVDPHKLRGVEAKEAQTYLQKYFEPAHFVVKWGTSQNFVQQLWKEWQAWR